MCYILTKLYVICFVLCTFRLPAMFCISVNVNCFSFSLKYLFCSIFLFLNSILWSVIKWLKMSYKYEHSHSELITMCTFCWSILQMYVASYYDYFCSDAFIIYSHLSFCLSLFPVKSIFIYNQLKFKSIFICSLVCLYS